MTLIHVNACAHSLVLLLNTSDIINENSDRYRVFKFGLDNSSDEDINDGMIKIIDKQNNRGYAITLDRETFHVYESSEDLSNKTSLSSYTQKDLDSMKSETCKATLLLKMVRDLEGAGVTENYKPLDYVSFITDPDYPKSWHDTPTDGFVAGRIVLSKIDGVYSYKTPPYNEFEHCDTKSNASQFCYFVAEAIKSVSFKKGSRLKDVLDILFEVCEGDNQPSQKKLLYWERIFNILTANKHTEQFPFTYNDSDHSAYAFETDGTKLIVHRSEYCNHLIAIKGEHIFGYSFKTGSSSRLFESDLPKLYESGTILNYKQLALSYIEEGNPSLTSGFWLTKECSISDALKDKPKHWAMKNNVYGERAYTYLLFANKYSSYLYEALVKEYNEEPLVYNPEGLDIRDAEPRIQSFMKKCGLNRAAALANILFCDNLIWSNGSPFNLVKVNDLSTSFSYGEKVVSQPEFLIPVGFFLSSIGQKPECLLDKIPSDISESWWASLWDFYDYMKQSIEFREPYFTGAKIHDLDETAKLAEVLFTSDFKDRVEQNGLETFKVIEKTLLESAKKHSLKIPAKHIGLLAD
ncbi:hypothetical protein [Vibrio sp. D431a]|uniref:hypothetical protein n=1 Tax=Vibrio sp. D431a TaxID=2837388 RepID=UPI002555DB63|nr:hypothetical protein [Vibrio sp. D431a]MDK9789926.1 hypothetical protein [Vibrio sp. D431a]